MKHMKGKLFAVLLVCLLSVLLTSSAWARPNWIGIKGYAAIVRNENQNDPNSGTYKRFRFTVMYTNNSKDKIIRAIFDKTLDVTCDMFLRNGYKIAHYTMDPPHNFTAVNKCELWPGQSIKLNYYPYLDIAHWKDAAQRRRFNTNEIILKDIKWTHDFRVRTENL